jgi:putative PIN family toxin of toxin-antitoxin system
VTIVLDTNVLVSGLLTPRGAPGRVVDLVIGGSLQLLVDDRILKEYRDVLSRGRFGFSPGDVSRLLDFVTETATPVLAAPLLRRLPDSTDEPFLEVALSGRADALVTGNARHFPAAATVGVDVLSPLALLARVRGG